mgnify:CR=1 FL=1
MRGLKFLVIFMGVLIVIGTSLLLYLMILKNKNIKNVNYQSEDPLEISVNIPKNSKILNITSSQNHIILELEENNKYKILIIDISSGKVVKKININEN